jgi:ABC-type polysaccharide/polyol phosphate export permease
VTWQHRSADIGAKAVTTIAADRLTRQALDDLVLGLARYEVWTHFAVHDVQQRFRRSVLGPLWLTLSMAVMVGALGLVSHAFLGAGTKTSLAYIATGLVFWTLISSGFTEGATLFIGKEAYLRNVPQPISVHLYRLIASLVITSGFNLIIYVVAFFLSGLTLNWYVLAFIPGLFLLIANVAWIALSLAILSARYRDIPPIVTNLVQVMFFVTPIFWSPDALPERPAFVQFNPAFHLLEIVRGPLLGQPVPMASWAWAIALTIVGGTGTVWLYTRAYPRLAYWI